MRVLWYLAMLVVPLLAGEAEAVRLSEVLRSRHLPYGTVLDPVFDSPDGDRIVSYSRCGDSAIWTGHWLAGEAYRYGVARSVEALANVRVALEGIRRLVAVTGTGLLARCAFPIDSPYAPDMISEERDHGMYRGRIDDAPWVWIGNTSRDQYMGVFFGLTAAYNLVDEPAVRDTIDSLTTTMLDRLREDAWTVRMPDGVPSTTFLFRPDQRLALLKLGRRTNEPRFGGDYKVGSATMAPYTFLPVSFDSLDDHGSYFKFNLDHITLYCLLTGGDSAWVKANYAQAFSILRKNTSGHFNAFFNLIERAVSEKGDPDREEETIRLLEEWLGRPRRDEWVDLRGQRSSCRERDRACTPIPVAQRVRTDFLWQRSPFLLYGGGSGRIESAGIDYILPYWMARYYGVE